MTDLKKYYTQFKDTNSTPEAKKEAFNKLLEIMALHFKPEAVEIVKTVEAKFATTQNHYGDYMAILSQAPDTLTRYGLAEAIKNNGGNSSGVNSALQILSGGY